MPSLPDQRQESFCQYLAEGHTKSEAHRLAGYGKSSAHASTLSRRGHIVARVEELLEARAAQIRAEAEAKYLVDAPALSHRRLADDKLAGDTALAIRARVDAAAPDVVDIAWIRNQLLITAKAAREQGAIGAANKALLLLEKLRVAQEFLGLPRRAGRAPAFAKRGWGHSAR